MTTPGIDNLANTLDHIVDGSSDTSKNSKPIGELVESRNEDVRKESQAIRDGLKAAQATTAQVEASLRDIEQALSDLSNNLNSVIQDGTGSSLQSSLLQANQLSLSTIKSSNDNLQTLRADLAEFSNVELQTVDTSNLENLATGLGTNEEAVQARSSLKNALDSTLNNRFSVNLVAKQLGQQLVTAEDVSQGTLGLSRFTDADLLLDVARNSQLEEQLHTEVLVKAEASQQNRRIGQLLNQLS